MSYHGRKQQTAGNRTPKYLLFLRRELIQAAKYRPQPFKNKINRESKNAPSLYEQAKEAETSHRQLDRAAELYAEAAKSGEKIDSCLKDFASVVHQMGETSLAVSFLREARRYYQGDLLKFDRLVTTLDKQINPSGKHQTKHLLVELSTPMQANSETLEALFQNTSRIRAAKAYKNLNFTA